MEDLAQGAGEPLLVRGMQACAHETYFDCPYFEQMQYVGDLRLEALTQYAMTRDDRLTAKGLYLVEAVNGQLRAYTILSVSELESLERANIERALEACGGKISGPNGAATRLGLAASTGISLLIFASII